MEYYCESLEMNSEGRIIEVVPGTYYDRRAIIKRSGYGADRSQLSFS